MYFSFLDVYKYIIIYAFWSIKYSTLKLLVIKITAHRVNPSQKYFQKLFFQIKPEDFRECVYMCVYIRQQCPFH